MNGRVKLLIFSVGVLILSPACTGSRTERDGCKVYPRSKAYNASRFKQAYALIDSERPDYKEALSLLQQNILDTPHAVDIDYDYGWAMVCAAHLEDYGLALEYYTVIRTRFYGWQTETNTHRNWDSKCETVRGLIARSDEENASDILKKMEALDKSSAEQLKTETLELIEKAKDGDQDAVMSLRSKRYQDVLVDIVTAK